MTEKTDIAELQEFFISQKKSNRYFRYYLENCVRCGSCIENCHFYQGDYTNDLNAPVFKNEQVRRLIKQKSLLGKLGLYGRPSADYVDSLSYAVFESCTNCRRCVIFCPFSIDISIINTVARAGLIKIDKAPEMLLMLADMQIQRRENVDDYIEMFTEQVNDLENEIRKEVGDSSFRMPIAEKGARILYVPLSGAITMTSPAKIFHAAKESWTMSKFDVVNFGFLVGDTERAKKILKPILDEAEEVGAEKLVIGECGHAFKLASKIAERWYGRLPFEVELVVETVANYVKEGTIQFDKSKNPERITHHDPCQHARNSGIFEEPRIILREAATEFVEMTPNLDKNWCCGGGGGLIAVPDFNKTRRIGGEKKVEQIKATRAKILTTTCENCKSQIEDLNEYYNLGIRIEGVVDVAARALIYK